MSLTKLLFELSAEFYAWMTWQQTWRAHCRSLVDKFGEVGAQAMILDVGIGPGVSGISIKDRLPTAKVVGLDFSARMLKVAQRYISRTGVEIELVEADAKAMPFEDARFDIVTGHSFLYLLPEREAVVEEIWRVLKPGGRVVFLEPHADATWGELLRVEGEPKFKLSMWLWRLVSGQIGPFTANELSALFEPRFEQVEVEETLGRLGLWVVAKKPI